MTMTTTRLEDRLGAEGFTPGAPDWHSWQIGETIDRDAARSSSCERCRHRGMTYVPFIRRQERRYRAFAVCPACGFDIEF